MAEQSTVSPSQSIIASRVHRMSVKSHFQNVRNNEGEMSVNMCVALRRSLFKLFSVGITSLHHNKLNTAAILPDASRIANVTSSN